MLKLSHKKLDTWQESILLTKDIYLVTANFPSDERFGLTSQMRRSAVSIPSNIAEGASRSSRKERRRFYEIARSSLVELDTQIELSLKLNLLTDGVEEFDGMFNLLFAKLTNQIKNT